MSMRISDQTKRRNELIDDMVSFLAIELKKKGFTEDEAIKDISFNLIHQWRGLTFVFPVKTAFYFERQKKQILLEYNGRNMVDIVRKYGVGETTIYRWYKDAVKLRKQEVSK